MLYKSASWLSGTKFVTKLWTLITVPGPCMLWVCCLSLIHSDTRGILVSLPLLAACSIRALSAGIHLKGGGGEGIPYIQIIGMIVVFLRVEIGNLSFQGCSSRIYSRRRTRYLLGYTKLCFGYICFYFLFLNVFKRIFLFHFFPCHVLPQNEMVDIFCWYNKNCTRKHNYRPGASGAVRLGRAKNVRRNKSKREMARISLRPQRYWGSLRLRHLRPNCLWVSEDEMKRNGCMFTQSLF